LAFPRLAGLEQRLAQGGGRSPAFFHPQSRVAASPARVGESKAPPSSPKTLAPAADARHLAAGVAPEADRARAGDGDDARLPGVGAAEGDEGIVREAGDGPFGNIDATSASLSAGCPKSRNTRPDEFHLGSQPRGRARLRHASRTDGRGEPDPRFVAGDRDCTARRAHAEHASTRVANQRRGARLARRPHPVKYCTAGPPA